MRWSLNIELASQRYHEAKRKQLFTERRDKYLQTLGISIKRIKFGGNPQWKAEISEKIMAVSKKIIEIANKNQTGGVIDDA